MFGADLGFDEVDLLLGGDGAGFDFLDDLLCIFPLASGWEYGGRKGGKDEPFGELRLEWPCWATFAVCIVLCNGGGRR